MNTQQLLDELQALLQKRPDAARLPVFIGHAEEAEIVSYRAERRKPSRLRPGHFDVDGAHVRLFIDTD